MGESSERHDHRMGAPMAVQAKAWPVTLVAARSVNGSEMLGKSMQERTC